MGFQHLRLGVPLAILTAALSGISVYVAKFGTQAVPDPFVYTTARNLTVGLALLAMLMAGRRGEEIHALSRANWLRLGLIAFIGGSVPFLLFFWGLTMTDAATGSIIQKAQFVWVALLAAPLLGERLTRLHLVALAAILGSVAIGGPVGIHSIGPGEGLILAATLLWAGESVLARRTLREVSPLLGASARMAGGATILLVGLGVTGRLPVLLHLSADQVLWIVGPSVLLLGYVLSWYTALRHAPAVVVTSALALGAPITALLAAGGSAPQLAARIGSSVALWSFANAPLLSTILLVAGLALLVSASAAPAGRRTIDRRSTTVP